MAIIKSHIVKILLFILLITANEFFAQRIRVPVEVQFKVIPKILSLNKSYDFKNMEDLDVGILFSRTQRNSNQIYEEFIELKNNNITKIRNNVLSMHAIDIDSSKNLREIIKKKNIKILYITPLRGIDVSEISSICKEANVLTITGVEEYLENGVSVILSLINNKLKIIINQPSAKSEGVNFSSKLLKIAKLVD